MQSKELHILFQVMNFLRSSDSKKYKLLPIDKLILITLASHKGAKGIFPMQETLANTLETSLRYMKTRLKYLEKNDLIFVEKIHRKNYYHLIFLSTIGDPQITYDEISGDPQITSQVIHRSPHRGSTDATNNKVSNKLNKTERERSKRAHSLPDDFVVSKESTKAIREMGFTPENRDEVLDKFLDYYRGKGTKMMDWQIIVVKWFKAERKDSKANSTPKDEVRSTVPWYKPEEVCRNERGLSSVGKLLNGLATKAREHLDKQGGKPNGLGSQEKGERKKT